MQRFSIIGTAHVEDPQLFEALQQALQESRPDQLILEIPDHLVAAGQVERQKPEMVFAYRWAREHGVAVRGHEPSGPSILRDGLTSERTGRLVQEMDALVAGLAIGRSIDMFCDRDTPATAAERRLRAVIGELVDPEKALNRTRSIIANVRQLARPDGAVTVICGGAHTPHLAAALPGRIVQGEHFY